MSEHDPAISRRAMLVGGAAGVVVAIGGAAYAVAPTRVRKLIGLGPDPYIPDTPDGTIRLERVHSEQRGADVDLFTAVPAGFGDGAGLPVVVIMHGASATPSDYQDLGFGRFLTKAVRDGVEPFVLAGADGGPNGWEPSPGDDPQAMVVDELPGWLDDRGFDVQRRALWGWSLGGYGALRLTEAFPDWPRALAAYSPAIGSDDDPVFDDLAAFADVPIGLWCGEQDPYYDTTRTLATEVQPPPEEQGYGDGGHTWVFWNQYTLDAFAFLAAHLG